MRLTRSRAAWLCLTAGTLLLIAAIPVTWIGVRIRSADRYTATVAPLASEPAIQAQVATAVGTNVASRVDVTGIADRIAPGRGAQVLVDAPSAFGVLLALAVSVALYLGVRGLGWRAAV